MISIVHNMPDVAVTWADVSQGHLGLSKLGATQLYTGSFAGCTAVIVTETDGRGGLLAHISQMGGDDYLVEATGKAVTLGISLWQNVDVALLRGEKTPPSVAAMLAGAPPSKIHSCLDFREESRTSDWDPMLFDPTWNRLFVWSGLWLPNHDPEEPVARGSLAIAHGSGYNSTLRVEQYQ